MRSSPPGATKSFFWCSIPERPVLHGKQDGWEKKLRPTSLTVGDTGNSTPDLT